MSVGLVIVTHGESGADLRAEAEFILGESLEALRAVPFNHSAGQREEIYQIHSAIAAADSGDGVLVLTCHEGNCKSEKGNTYASWRVEDAQCMLEEAGYDKERLRFATLASNMGKPWDDELEPFRHAGDGAPIRWLHRVG